MDMIEPQIKSLAVDRNGVKSGTAMKFVAVPVGRS
jgi:hypothetical protein